MTELIKETPFVRAVCAPISMIEVSATGSYYAHATVDNEVSVWQGDQLIFNQFIGNSIFERVKGIDRVRAMLIDEANQQLYVACGGRLIAFALPYGDIRWVRSTPAFMCFLMTSPVCLAQLPSGSIVITTEDGIMEIYNPDGLRLNQLKFNDAPLKIFADKQEEQIYGTDHFEISVWDMKSKVKVGSSEVSEKIFGFVGSEDGRYFATRSLSKVQVRLTENCELVTEFEIKSGLPHLAIHAGRSLVASNSEGGVVIYDFSGNLINEIKLDATRVNCFQFLPDGEALLLGTSAGTIIKHQVSA